MNREQERTELADNIRLPWHKPEVARLNVTLDTRDAGGSSGDGAFGTATDAVFL